MVHTVVQAGAILLFLVVGWSRPRVPSSPLIWDTLINVVTGLFLFGVRLKVFTVAPAAGSWHLVDLQGIRHPLAQFAVVLLLNDFVRYWLHVAHHRVPLLWRFHRVHHSSETLNATSGVRMHLVDFIQLSLVPLVLFGLVFDCRSYHAAVWIALGAVTNGLDAFQHANIAMDLRQPWTRAWNRLFNNPYFHSWHHSVDPAAYDGNYGQALTIWDHLFGTAIHRDEPATEYGLPRSIALHNSFFGLQLLRPRPVPVKRRS